MGSRPGWMQRRSDCIATSLLSHLPTSCRVSPGACLLVVAPSRRASFKLREFYKKSRLPAEVCEKMRRDGGSVFPAHANTGDPFGPIEAFPLMSSHAR